MFSIALPILFSACVVFAQETDAKQPQSSKIGELSASEPSSQYIPFLISTLSVDDVRHLVSSGITIRNLRYKIGSIIAMSSRHEYYYLKDGMVRLPSYSDDEIATSSSVIATLTTPAEKDADGNHH